LSAVSLFPRFPLYNTKVILSPDAQEETMFARTLALISIPLLGSAMPAQDLKLHYPLTKTDNVVDVLHGVKIVDPYRWLEDGSSAAVKDWVDEQNKLTQLVLTKFPGREEIRRRLSSLLEIGSLGSPKP